MFVSATMYANALFLLLGDNSERSKSLVKEFLEVADKNATKKEIPTDDDDLITAYRSLIRSVIQENITQENTTASKMLLVRLPSVLKEHPVQRDLLTDILTARDPVTADQIDEYLKSLRNTVAAAEIDKNIRQLFGKSRGLSDILDPELQEIEIGNIKQMVDTTFKAIEYRQSSSGEKASESFVSMSDPESIERSLTKYMERSVKGVLRSGLQGLNKSLGKRGGVGLGDSVVFAALSHHYKSGMLVSWMDWAVEYNGDVVKIAVEPGKKALVYFVSLENEVHENVMFVFKSIYARVEKKHIDVTNISVEWAKEWLINHFAKFNIELIIDRWNPHEFSYEKWVKRYNSFVEMGYQLIAFVLDYLSEAKGIDPGDTMSAAGHMQLIKENYIKFCNHGKQAGYAFFTGHQLNRKAEDMAASIRQYAVKRFNPAMVADSSDVFRPVDIFFFLLIETNLDDVKFLTAINRKNRGNQDTPDAHKFFAYRFTEFGIQDDLDDLPGFVTDLDSVSSDRPADSDLMSNALF